jgi:TolA-binding protein
VPKKNMITLRTANRWLLGSIALALAIGNGVALAAPGTADSPGDKYWFLKPASEREQGLMDPALQQVSDAYGKADFVRCRELAQGVLETTEDERTRAEAMAYVVEAWVAEGDLAKAAQVAAGCHDTGLVARVASRRDAYATALARLGQSRTDGEGGSAALREARVHRQAGLLEPAQKSYWRVITEYPDSRETVRAVRELINMHQVYGTQESVAKVCQMVVRFAPDGKEAIAACEAMSGSWAAWSGAGPAPPLAVLRMVATDHPGTQASDAARYLIGKLYAADGQDEAAEGAWAALVAERPKAKEVNEARLGLADLRYKLGIKAFTDRDYEHAAHWLGELLPDIEMLEPRSVAVRMETPKAGALRSDQRHVAFSYGEACEKLGRWAEAAGAYERLAIAGSPGEEIALSKLVHCYLNLGDQAQARRACDQLMQRFPEGPHTKAARKLL